jgi:phosphocarrier protein HPr
VTRAARTFEIVNELGLHARAAVKLTQVAQKYSCDVKLSREGQIANGKSVMGVLLLCGSKGSMIEVTCDGDQADEAADAIGELIKNKFGEPR